MKVVDPHKNISRIVVDEDIEKVLQDADGMLPIANKPLGIHSGFYAIAHQQVEKDRPLRFFVINPMMPEFRGWRSVVVINPVIMRHTNSLVYDKEGCASFCRMPSISVGRWHKCEVEFSALEFDQNRKPFIGRRRTLNLSGRIARIFQHEVDHLDAKYIYDDK